MKFSIIITCINIIILKGYIYFSGTVLPKYYLAKSGQYTNEIVELISNTIIIAIPLLFTLTSFYSFKKFKNCQTKIRYIYILNLIFSGVFVFIFTISILFGILETI